MKSSPHRLQTHGAILATFLLQEETSHTKPFHLPLDYSCRDGMDSFPHWRPKGPEGLAEARGSSTYQNLNGDTDY